MNSKTHILDLDLDSLRAMIETWEEPDYRVNQIWEGLYRQYWGEPEQFTNLPHRLRQKLGEAFDFWRLSPVAEQVSGDKKTIKTLFRLPSGDPLEAVLMLYDKRRTLCISTQAGCGMGCVFCATGQMGFKKNLTSGEIIEQVVYFSRKLQLVGDKVTNVVVMGMGEPFQNYDATIKAIYRLNHPAGLNLGSRRFTISTVGLAPVIDRFTDENHQINLAISLHAATDTLRSSLLPINQKYPLHVLLDSCLNYVKRTRRRITFEWALIQGVNDSLEQAEELSRLLVPFRFGSTTLCHVNVIPLNPTHKYSGLPSEIDQAKAFKAKLETNGIPCTIRARRGIDIQAGCGQLAAEE